jgi:PGF-pre-PGF domain-containing protein
LNVTVYDANGALNNLTVWFYGGYANGSYFLINTLYNQTNGTNLVYNWSLGISGKYNWTVIVNDGIVNSTNSFYYFNLTNFSISCEAGGPYQQNALVLVQGTIKNESLAVLSYPLNLSLYDVNNNLDANQNSTTASDGGFETSFSGLSVGSYLINATATYKGYTEYCQDTFIIGGSASLVLDKILNFYNQTNTTIMYNITLRLTNKGGSDVISTTLIDSDSNDSSYSLGNVSANSTLIRSYLKEYNITSSGYTFNLSIATVNGTDSYSGNDISINSTQIILSIPGSSSGAGQQVTLTKNAYYNSENSTTVNYTVSLAVVNSGVEDLSGISLIDTDLGINTNINLENMQNYSYTSSILVDKAASNTNKLFVKASATISNVSYESNQIRVRIPGYGGPADAIVNAPASVSTSTSFSTTITVENQNPDVGQDFTIDYWITKSDETVNYSSGQQTIYVASSGSSDLTASLISPSTVGSYRLRALVSWVGGTATAYDSFTVTSSDGGTATPPGGGGSTGGTTTPSISTPITNIVSVHYETADSGSTISIETGREDFAIINASFNVMEKINDIDLSIKKVDDISEVSEQLSSCYGYYELERINIDGTLNTTINFKVNKSWIESNGYDANKVSLNRYHDRWVKLPTNLTGENSANYYYQAITPGFSLFAIIAEKASSDITGEAVSEVICKLPEIRFGEGCCFDNNDNAICDSNEPSEKKVGLSTKTGVLILIILLVLAGAVLVISRLDDIMYVIYGSIKEILPSMKSKLIIFKKEERDPTRLTHIVGIGVYSSGGHIIGKIKEACLNESNSKIDKWSVEVSKEIAKKIGKKFILVRSEMVLSISQIMIIDERVYGYIERLEKIKIK